MIFESMKKLLVILAIPILSFGQIYFEEIENKDDCHACPGFLVVTKNQLKDTIVTGSWGKVNSNYNIQKIGNKKYIVLESNYFSGGALEEGIHIYSTAKKDFLKKVFSKFYLTRSQKYKQLDNGHFQITSIEKDMSYKFENNYLNIQLDTVVFITIEPEENGKMISKGTKKEKYFIKN
tara:strand:- start:600 stop:1133 length:534 start_codon:yes stop_codon:yes gene_type:complete